MIETLTRSVECVTRSEAQLPLLERNFFLRAREGAPAARVQRQLHAEAEALHAIEVRPAPDHGSLNQVKTRGESLRIAAWNLERCKHIGPSAELIRQSGAGISFLSEMDYGMARSGNRHTTREVADQLNAGYAFATEFIEIGLGTQQEEARFKGKYNAEALHGNAVISSLPFHNPVIIRLDEDTPWFNLDWHHRRVGGRNALAVTIDALGEPVFLVSLHLETETNPEGRAIQAKMILDYLDSACPNVPAVLAGDFNTAALPFLDRPLNENEDWFEKPEKFEPLFRHLQEAGFDWQKCNTKEQTRRMMKDGRPEPALKRVDWFFTRGLQVANPIVWKAQDAQGQPLSDHEMITLDIALP
jgi:endonuclease/exonuclease/phosphatase family metal-dependent hydrolase